MAQEATDLYQLDLATGNVRRLTTDGDDGWIIPEFTWDPTNSYVLWTESRFQTARACQSRWIPSSSFRTPPSCSKALPRPTPAT